MNLTRPAAGYVTCCFVLLVSIIGLGFVMRNADSAHATGAQPQSLDGAPFKSLDYAVQWDGPHSDVKIARFVRITDHKGWRELWEKHRGDRVEHALTGWALVPNVNFDKYMIIGVFGGERLRCNGYGIEALDEFSDHLRLRYDAITFQVSTGFGEKYDESEDRGHPFGLFVVPKSDKRIVLEENKQGLIGSPPKWVQTHHMPAL